MRTLRKCRRCKGVIHVQNFVCCTKVLMKMFYLRASTDLIAIAIGICCRLVRSTCSALFAPSCISHIVLTKRCVPILPVLYTLSLSLAMNSSRNDAIGAAQCAASLSCVSLFARRVTPCLLMKLSNFSWLLGETFVSCACTVCDGKILTHQLCK